MNARIPILYILNNPKIWLDAEANVDFTVVRPAGLTDSAVTEAEFKVAEDDYHVRRIIIRVIYFFSYEKLKIIGLI